MTDINIVFFASLKERLGIDHTRYSFTVPISILALKQFLANELVMGELLLEQGIQSSMDYEFARDGDMITRSVKEIAFFPPVTGG